MKAQEIDLLNRAIDTFNSASATLVEYYRVLEERVRFLTDEVDRKKNLLDSILNSVDVGVVFFDEKGTIRLINGAAERLLGVTSEEVVGRKEIPATIEDEYVLPERGKPFYAIVEEAQVRDSSGRTIGKVLLLNDVTRLRKLELENERNRRLSAMGELVLKIAHEIRNPLGSIELFAGLLSKDLAGTKQAEFAARITQSVRLLVNTLDNMLRFSRDMTPVKEFGLLNDFVREVCSEFRELAASRKVRIRVEEEEMCWMLFDRGLLRQALVNLILNAIHAMPDGGDLTVSLRLFDRASRVELTVTDTGEGMDAETLRRVFEPFFSTKDRGTGLGMSIVRSIVEAHGGSVTLESAKGEGTRVRIVLPAFEEGVGESEPEKSCL
ncbi:MAG: PAS domain S-box protein [Deltaproteobacteria bacterium]|nr:MAG: PAS domain S-box protein [Deltaproteobacteria bacterium]